MYLLPKDDPTMKRIMDENLQYCDIYVKDTSNTSCKQQVEDFLRFVEMHLNKIKRIKKPRVSKKPIRKNYNQQKNKNKICRLMSEA